MSTEKNPIAASLAADIATHCTEFEQSPEYAEMIRVHVKQLYDKAIKETFSWGKFPDRVKKALEDALPANISEMADLPRYNLILAKELQSQWEGQAVSDGVVSHMQKTVTDFIQSHQVPKFIKASDLWEAFIEDHQEEAAHDGWSRPEVLMEFSDSHDSDFFYVGLEKEPNESRLYSKDKTHHFQFDNYLSLSAKYEYAGREKKYTLQDGFKCYSVYSGKVDGNVLGKKIISFHSKFERLVAALYYGESLLVLDEHDPEDICYPNDY